MKHNQHDTNEEFKRDGDTLETKGGYRILEEGGWFNVHLPAGVWCHRRHSRYESEAIIRQHMHEANMANEFYIDMLAPFVPGQPWNGFEPGENGGWIFTGFDGTPTELSAPALLFRVYRIARGEIDDPRREHIVDDNKKVAVREAITEVLDEMRDMGVDVDRIMKEKPDCSPAPRKKTRRVFALPENASPEEVFQASSHLKNGAGKPIRIELLDVEVPCDE